jgi:hypothetical protein
VILLRQGYSGLRRREQGRALRSSWGEMGIEPVRKASDVEDHGAPAVFAPAIDDEFGLAADLPGLVVKACGLVERDEGVLVAVQNQSRGKVRGNEIDG